MDNLIPALFTIALLLLILTYRSVASAVGGSLSQILSTVKKNELATDRFFRSSSTYVFLLAIPIYALTLHTTCSDLGIGTISAILAGYFIFRTCAYALAGIVGDGKAASDGFYAARSLFILLAIVSLPAAVLPFLFPVNGKGAACFWLAAVAIAAGILIAISGWKTIRSLKFSFVFSFLYLCGLEILPIIAAVKVLVS